MTPCVRTRVRMYVCVCVLLLDGHLGHDEVMGYEKTKR